VDTLDVIGNLRVVNGQESPKRPGSRQRGTRRRGLDCWRVFRTDGAIYHLHLRAHL